MPAMNPQPDDHRETPPLAPPAPKPAAERELGRLGKAIAVCVALVSAAYLTNPTLGIFELLPDNIPGVGNLDEAFFTIALISALGALGVRLPFLRHRS
ncbi:MAG: hypothetical protein RL136_2245 [Planctomycetota bacterium]|jgi:hypothetical protein